MTAIETELADALVMRQTELLEAAGELAELADGPLTVMGLDPSDELRLLRNLAARVTRIEALTAVILNRAGVPWDAMCNFERRQTLHRRLSAEGESAYAEATHAGAHGGHAAETALSSLREQVNKAPPLILERPRHVASRLSELRNTPRWWRE